MYYDSSAGTFLIEDSYAGTQLDPLSQNRYAYVENNPVNYTDPSGHFLKGLIKGAKNLYNKAVNAGKSVVKSVAKPLGNLVKSAVNIGTNLIKGIINAPKAIVNFASK